jgi:hypothetical protein
MLTSWCRKTASPPATAILSATAFPRVGDHDLHGPMRGRRRTGCTDPRCAARHDRNLPREISCPTTPFVHAIRVELDILMIRSMSSTPTP